MRAIASVLTAGVTSRVAPDGATSTEGRPRGSNVAPAVRTTRITRVLEDLRAAGFRGFCAWNWYREARPNDRNAPSEIATLPGFQIRSEPCQVDDHPASGHYARHWLVREPTEQLGIFGEGRNP